MYKREVHNLSDQLLTAFRSKGWSISRLLEASGMVCDKSSLHRKLHGRQKLSTTECQALAIALGTTVTFPLRKRS